MLPTPSTSHVSFDTIYEPAEDSFLLLDTLSSHNETCFLTSRLPYNTPTPLVAEIGTGSGVVLAFLAAHARSIFSREILTLGIDVNTNACHATAQTVSVALREHESKSLYLGSICADLCTVLLPGSVDVLIFNPPYVPTETLPTLPHLQEIEDSYERDSQLLSLSYAGGVDGMVTTNRLLEQIPTVLSEKGVAYVLFCRQNRPEEVKEEIRQQQGMGKWNAETVGRSGKVAGWEKLEIVRIWRD